MNHAGYNPEANSESPIGIFDSGVGGLSVLKAIRHELPHENLVYFADQANVPYGSKSLSEVQGLSERITRLLLEIGVKLIVIACNTASAAALHWLRSMYPATPFIGMEPAVKPAAEETLTGRVGVLATPATFQGALYASVLERFAREVKVYQDTCPGLVQQIESGDLTSQRTRQILEQALKPMLSENIDRIVLGCTHYPFVIPLIENISGSGVRVIDPSPAVARQVRRVLINENLLSEEVNNQGEVKTYTSGDPYSLDAMFTYLVGFRSQVLAATDLRFMNT